MRQLGHRPSLAGTLGLALVAGCATPYLYGQLSQEPAPAKPAGCGFTLLDALPDRACEEIGVLAPKDIVFGDVAGGPTSFKEAVGDKVCAVGGDAVVIERDGRGRYVRGTIVRWK